MKMKPFHALLALLLVLGLGFIIFKKIRKTNAPDSHAGARPSVVEFDLNDAERKTLMDQAEAGNADAAYKLALYYEMLRLDYTKGEHWFAKAAVLGHAGAKKWLDDIADRRHRFSPENLGAAK